MSDWFDQPLETWWSPREDRYGYSGLGGRPVLHPAWREPPHEIAVLRASPRRLSVVHERRGREAA